MCPLGCLLAEVREPAAAAAAAEAMPAVAAAQRLQPRRAAAVWVE